MSTQVVMPQMGESIVEGTITKWHKKPGEPVERDEPLFEITTDKVDTEVPSPASGVLEQILVPEDETVAVGTIVGRSRSDPAGRHGGTLRQARHPRSRSSSPEFGGSLSYP